MVKNSPCPGVWDSRGGAGDCAAHERMYKRRTEDLVDDGNRGEPMTLHEYREEATLARPTSQLADAWSPVRSDTDEDESTADDPGCDPGVPVCGRHGRSSQFFQVPQHRRTHRPGTSCGDRTGDREQHSVVARAWHEFLGYRHAPRSAGARARHG